MRSSANRFGRYRAAIIGLGRIASTIDDEVVGTNWLLPFSHMGSYREVPEIDVVGAADLYAEQREAFGQRYGLDRGLLFADFHEMLEKTRPQVVSVCTNARHRHDVILDIARMQVGTKVIWAEKPLAISLQEADEMVAACREAGIALAVNNLRRWHPWFVMARKLIDEGALGEIQYVHSFQPGTWSNNSHMVDLARFMSGGDGRIAWVFGDMESDEAAASDNDTRGVGLWRMANGAYAHLRTIKTGAADEVDVIGSEGRIRALNNGVQWELGKRVGEGEHAEFALHQFPRPQRIASPGVMAVRDFIEVIETGKAPNCTGHDGVAHLEAILAMRESHRRGGVRVNLPLTDRTLRIVSSEVVRWDLPRAIAARRVHEDVR